MTSGGPFDFTLDLQARDLVNLSVVLRWPLLLCALLVFLVCAFLAETNHRSQRLRWILRAETAFRFAGCLAAGPPFLLFGYAIRDLRRDRFFSAFYYLVSGIIYLEQERLLFWWEHFMTWLFPPTSSWLSGVLSFFSERVGEISTISFRL